MRRLKVVSFDCEARPLSWISQDYVSKELTAIAWADAVGPFKPSVALLGPQSTEEMLSAFSEAYRAADVVTGHYIRGYDLPLIQSALLEFGLPPLGPKLTQDTKGDLLKFQGVSKSQESLGATLGLSAPKVGMNQAKWRAANRLDPHGIEETRRRVVGDVKQQIQLRKALLARGLLRAPRLWDPGSAGLPGYEP